MLWGCECCGCALLKAASETSVRCWGCAGKFGDRASNAAVKSRPQVSESCYSQRSCNQGLRYSRPPARAGSDCPHASGRSVCMALMLCCVTYGRGRMGATAGNHYSAARVGRAQRFSRQIGLLQQLRRRRAKARRPSTLERNLRRLYRRSKPLRSALYLARHLARDKLRAFQCSPMHCPRCCNLMLARRRRQAATFERVCGITAVQGTAPRRMHLCYNPLEHILHVPCMLRCMNLESNANAR